MRKIAKLLSLFYESQMLLGSLGMALYCYFDLIAFGYLGKESRVNQRLFLLTASLVPPSRPWVAKDMARHAQS